MTAVSLKHGVLATGDLEGRLHVHLLHDLLSEQAREAVAKLGHGDDGCDDDYPFLSSRDNATLKVPHTSDSSGSNRGPSLGCELVGSAAHVEWVRSMVVQETSGVLATCAKDGSVALHLLPAKATAVLAAHSLSLAQAASLLSQQRWDGHSQQGRGYSSNQGGYHHHHQGGYQGVTSPPRSNHGRHAAAELVHAWEAGMPHMHVHARRMGSGKGGHHQGGASLNSRLAGLSLGLSAQGSGVSSVGHTVSSSSASAASHRSPLQLLQLASWGLSEEGGAEGGGAGQAAAAEGMGAGGGAAGGARNQVCG